MDKLLGISKAAEELKVFSDRSNGEKPDLWETIRERFPVYESDQ
jgi:hypothetical protein